MKKYLILSLFFSMLDERNMTLDSRGTIYFTGGLGYVSAGIVAFGPLSGDIDRNARVDLKDAVLAAKVLVNTSSQEASFSGDVNGDRKIGLDEFIYILQRSGGLR
jgi:hypothetical protein